ncbi:hypothetical protein R3I94_019266 [Phoxinus phoxinus]
MALRNTLILDGSKHQFQAEEERRASASCVPVIPLKAKHHALLQLMPVALSALQMGLFVTCGPSLRRGWLSLNRDLGYVTMEKMGLSLTGLGSWDRS